ncbi:MAG: hypothetical protein ABS79_00280 [Planctomycetes bacterium SCN 63-9]|nr:MAG: hypothetical protein ABS79_00280 [Planctomycetes bacterium SCN 63-9]
MGGDLDDVVWWAITTNVATRGGPRVWCDSGHTPETQLSRRCRRNSLKLRLNLCGSWVPYPNPFTFEQAGLRADLESLEGRDGG